MTANTAEDLFYAQGWAQMHNHANLILRLYGRSRGKVPILGRGMLQDDKLVQTLLFEELADEWEKKQDLETKALLSAFVDGMNDYAKAHPRVIHKNNKQVLPLTVKDVNMHSMFVVFTRFIAGGELHTVQQWSSLGSNAYAIAPSRSSSGNALLLQNPHLPWSNEFLFFESHLMLNDKTCTGPPGGAPASPSVQREPGWTHTNNTIDNADTYELELQDGATAGWGAKRIRSD